MSAQKLFINIYNEKLKRVINKVISFTTGSKGIKYLVSLTNEVIEIHWKPQNYAERN